MNASKLVPGIRTLELMCWGEWAGTKAKGNLQFQWPIWTNLYLCFWVCRVGHIWWTHGTLLDHISKTHCSSFPASSTLTQHDLEFSFIQHQSKICDYAVPGSVKSRTPSVPTTITALHGQAWSCMRHTTPQSPSCLTELYMTRALIQTESIDEGRH